MQANVKMKWSINWAIFNPNKKQGKILGLTIFQILCRYELRIRPVKDNFEQFFILYFFKLWTGFNRKFVDLQKIIHTCFYQTTAGNL